MRMAFACRICNGPDSTIRPVPTIRWAPLESLGSTGTSTVPCGFRLSARPKIRSAATRPRRIQGEAGNRPAGVRVAARSVNTLAAKRRARRSSAATTRHGPRWVLPAQSALSIPALMGVRPNKAIRSGAVPAVAHARMLARGWSFHGELYTLKVEDA